MFYQLQLLEQYGAIDTTGPIVRAVQLGSRVGGGYMNVSSQNQLSAF